MNSIHHWMVTVGIDRVKNLLLVKLPLTKINKGVEHSKSIIIFANIKTFLMKGINCSIVTVIPKVKRILYINF